MIQQSPTASLDILIPQPELVYNQEAKSFSKRACHHFYYKYHVVLQALAAMAVFTTTKALLTHYGYAKVIALTSLTSSVIGTTTFLIGFVLSAVIQDFKESERLVTEVVASLETILQVGMFAAEIKPEFAMTRLRLGVLAVFRCLGGLLRTGDGILTALHFLERLQSDSVVEVHKLIGSSHSSRLQTELAAVNKLLLRVAHIKNASFIPAAYAIVEVMVTLNIIVMMITDLTPYGANLFLFSTVVYIFLYMLLFIRAIEDPFGNGRHAHSDIDLFVMKTLQAKLENSIMSTSSPAPPSEEPAELKQKVENATAEFSLPGSLSK